MLAAACGGDPVDPEPVPTTISIAPETATLEDAGETVQLTATVKDQNGETMPEVEVSWSSSDSLILEVSQAGLATGGEIGTATVTASVDMLSAEATVTVEPGVRAVLHTAYRKMGGDGWDDNTNWKTDEPLDAWHGVSTDGSGNVVQLNLPSNGLTGAISSELGMLRTLERLYLIGNELTGSIPPELGNLQSLQILNLRANPLTGSIPPELGNLENLRTLYLHGSELTGPIPPELGNLGRLVTLLLPSNGLTGAIPSELGNLRNLLDLDLGGNELTGAIPSELGNLTRLETMFLRQNELTGSVPPELGNLGSLKRLWIEVNQLTGPLPTDLTGIPLTSFRWNETDLCAPADDDFQAWLNSIGDHMGNPNCDALLGRTALSFLPGHRLALSSESGGTEHG